MRMRKKSTSKTYMRGATNWEMVFINKTEEEYCLTIKKINKIDQPFVVQEFGKSIVFIDDGYYIVEFTPLNQFYNARVFLDRNANIIGYYFDMSRENGLRDNVPYYDDLYLDVVYFPDENNLIEVLDEDELLDAFNEGKITKEEYELAKKVGADVIDEIRNNQNVFVNMDKKALIQKYFE